MTLDYRRESLDDVIAEIQPLLERNWREISDYVGDIPLDPSLDSYRAMERIGALFIFTARDADDQLVGYAVYFVSPHPHFRRDRWAISDIIWLAPEYRRGMAGIRMLKFVEGYLKGEQVSVMHTTGYLAHPALARVLERLGHDHVGFAYSKMLKDAA